MSEVARALGSSWDTTSGFFVFDGSISGPKFTMPVRHRQFIFHLIRSGSITVTVNLEQKQIGKNNLVIIRPDYAVQAQAIEPGTRIMLVAFDASVLDAELTHNHMLMQGPWILSLSDPEAAMVSGLIKFIENRLVDQQRPNRRQIGTHLISTFLLEIDSLYKSWPIHSEASPSHSQVVHHHFQNLLVANFTKERSVKFYADLLGISARHLTELTKEITGKRAGDLIDEMVILEAKIMLKNPEISIKKVAEGLNFADQFTFSKFFKKGTHLTPTRYRESQLATVSH